MLTEHSGSCVALQQLLIRKDDESTSVAALHYATREGVVLAETSTHYAPPSLPRFASTLGVSSTLPNRSNLFKNMPI